MGKRKAKQCDPFVKYIDRMMSDMDFTLADAGREWLGVSGDAFARRRRLNNFSLAEVRKIFRHCATSPEERARLLE